MPKHTEPKIEAAMTCSGVNHVSGAAALIAVSPTATMVAPAPNETAPMTLIVLAPNALNWSLAIISNSGRWCFIFAASRSIRFYDYVIDAV